MAEFTHYSELIVRLIPGGSYPAFRLLDSFLLCRDGKMSEKERNSKGSDAISA